MTRICVFAGSSVGVLDDYAETASRLGQALVSRGCSLVYGGANIGVMGVVADAVLAGGGEVIGVMPTFLVDREVAHRGLTELRVVESMHERKAVMSELSDGVVALPGGLGTLDEFFEALTWAQLGLHRKPCGLLNAAGYFDRLLRFLDHATDQQFVAAGHRAMLVCEDDPDKLLDGLGRQIVRTPEQ
jgi:uncharacterized protein (TIGR00730 family)